jgi:hypothetical protein
MRQGEIQPMTEETLEPRPAGLTATGSDGGVDFELRLDRRELLPGQLAVGAVLLRFRHDVDFRGIVAAMIATEQWQWERTHRDANGNTSTETVTERHELRRLPVRLEGPGRHNTGETREFRLELPVPPLGPATFDGTVSRLEWRLEVKLDVPGFDPSIETGVVVLQPTALLMAGVIDVAQFALWPTADARSDGATASIALDPVPLCIGAPFGGLLSIAAEATKLQEVRLELRAKVEATVSSGLKEEITLWTGRVAGEGVFGDERAMAFDGQLPARWMPTIRLPHGRSDATFHVILAKAMARDTHLVRDVAICSTTEL